MGDHPYQSNNLPPLPEQQSNIPTIAHTYIHTCCCCLHTYILTYIHTYTYTYVVVVTPICHPYLKTNLTSLPEHQSNIPTLTSLPTYIHTHIHVVVVVVSCCWSWQILSALVPPVFRHLSFFCLLIFIDDIFSLLTKDSPVILIYLNKIVNNILKQT